jgi:cellulose synthase/poly-beta-1,6-N-acetylglucosamine synthase-like glycosyltransferase
VERGALKRMLPHFDGDDDIAAVLPSLKVKDPSNILQKMQWYEYIINMFYKELMARLDSIHVAPGPFSIYRKSVVQKVGGFDEDHNLTEDLEMALRLQSHDYRLIQVLDTEVHTIAPSTLKVLYAQRNRWYKGSIINALKYKKMMFNRKYGDFGMIQMPTILISGIIALVLILSAIYYSIKPYVLYFQKMMLVDFDMMTFLRTYTFDFNILDLNYSVIFVAMAMIMITVFVIRTSHVSVNEKVIKFGFFTFFIYLVMYFFVLATMWIGIAFDLVIGKRQKW